MSVAASIPDFTTIAANVGVGAAIVAAIYEGFRRTQKKIKADDGPSGSTTSKIVGGMIMDNTTLLMWSESNRDVVDALRDQTKEMAELRFAITRLGDKYK